MAGLPKAIIAKHGITKKAWQVYRGTKSMVKRRISRTPSRRRRYISRAKRAIRRAGKMNPPLEMLIAAAAIPFTPAGDGLASPWDHVKQGKAMNPVALFNDLKFGFLGMKSDGSIDLFSALNPLDFNTARYTKMLEVAGIEGFIRKKLPWSKMQTALYRKIPFIGRRIS